LRDSTGRAKLKHEMDSPRRDNSLWARSRSATSLAAVGLLLCAALLGGSAPLRAAQFTASLDRDTITLGERATLSLTFNGGQPKDVPVPPAIPDLPITYVGPSSQFSFINGQVSSTVTHVFTVAPRQAGEFTIPALSADVGGQKLSTQPLKLKVLKPGAPPPEAINSGAQLAFMKLTLPKKEVYLGEVIAAEAQLYLRNGVLNIDQFQFTALPAEGFSVGKMVRGQQRQTQISDVAYTVIPVSIALTTIKAGSLAIGPVTASLVVRVPSTSRRSRDPFFDRLGFPDPFDAGGEQRQLALATDAESIRSLPLPAENVPPNFNGAVGSYTLTVTAGPTNVATGDPITVRVQIAGRGALDALTLPEQTAWRDFKTYAPTAKVETQDPLGIQGAKTFEQFVAPQNTDIKELPAFSFSFFDPDQKAYRTLTQPPVKLVVRPGGSTSVPVLAGKNGAPESPPPAQDIVPIKQRLGAVAQIAPPLAQQPWFLAMQGVPVLAWFAAFVWRRQTDRLANNPRLRRRRQVAQIIRDGLDDLRRLANENNSEEFFATLFRLLQEQLGERLDCPASAITEAVIEERLRPRGAPGDTLNALHELFQICNLARYAPVKSSQELAAHIPKLEAVLRELQNLEA
jgi:hypothetical protein